MRGEYAVRGREGKVGGEEREVKRWFVEVKFLCQGRQTSSKQSEKSKQLRQEVNSGKIYIFVRGQRKYI